MRVHVGTGGGVDCALRKDIKVVLGGLLRRSKHTNLRKDLEHL